MKAAEQVRLVVRGLDLDGAGVGLAGSTASTTMEVHVPGGLPGEEISARIDAVSTHGPVAWATLTAIHVPSLARVSPACPAHGRCGGCVLQHCDVSAQRSWKESRLRDLLRVAEPSLTAVPVAAMVASPRALGYRNNAKLVAARAPEDVSDGPVLVLGAYARRTHQVVDLAGCAIVEPPLESVRAALRALLQSHAVAPHDETRLTGELRYVILRASAAGQVLVTLVTSRESFPAGPAIARALRAAHPEVVGVVHNINPSRGNTIFGTRQLTLGGQPTIEDLIGTVRLRISSGAFFQANREVARAAYRRIVERLEARGRDVVVDAYAGVGGIALTLAPEAGTVLGIEEHPGATEDARASAALNGITNVRFVEGNVATRLGEIARADLIVLNPPRKGCGPEVLQEVARLGPRSIAYLSCAPETLLRDLQTLAHLGYGRSDLTPFDMLPHTPHIETLALIQPGGPAPTGSDRAT